MMGRETMRTLPKNRDAFNDEEHQQTARPHPGLRLVGRYWHFHLKINGQRSHGSTRCTDLATARKVLEHKRREIVKGQLANKPRVPTVRELVVEWLAINRMTFSKSHIKSSECAMRLWVLPIVGSFLLTQVTLKHAMELRARMLERGCSPHLCEQRIQDPKGSSQVQVRARYITDPFSSSRLRVQQKPRAIVPARQFRAFLDEVDHAAKNPHIAVVLKVMVGLGIREAEALGMRWEWFDPDQKTYIVGKAKGKEARVLPVPEWLWVAIHSMPKTISEWVFPAEDGKPHRAQFCKKALQRVCKELGLGNVTQHRLRATFASLHAEAGTPLSDIQGMLGHKSVTTTMIYIEQTLESKRKAQNTLSQKLGLA
ncbi:MAG: site-specific integrase [Holophaga sp.]|nr:site-specific integrase [Holophaga sp.]